MGYLILVFLAYMIGNSNMAFYLTRLRNGTEIGLRSAAKGDHRMN